MPTTTTTKQTARNNSFLARVKRVSNAKVFRKTSMILNLAGETEARDYLAIFFGPDVDAGMDRLIAILDRVETPTTTPAGWAEIEPGPEVEPTPTPAPDSTVILTTAPRAYDYGSTVELDPDAGRDNRNLVVRRVSIPTADFWYQTERYGSGMHGYVTPDEAARFSTIWRLNP
jgi:hypothetical protein